MNEADQKTAALNAILTAWEQALAKGVAPELLATTAMFAALTDMVDLHGEDAVAQLCDGLGERIRAGEFSLKDEG